jgi:hypothetical protein
MVSRQNERQMKILMKSDTFEDKEIDSDFGGSSLGVKSAQINQKEK